MGLCGVDTRPLYGTVSIGTVSFVSRESVMVRWAGRILVVLGAGHMLLGLILTVPKHAGAWMSLQLWSPDEGVLDMSPAMAAFWLTMGSLGVPLVVIGMLVLWLDRRGVVPPAFIAWTLGGWSIVMGWFVEPAPWVLIWVAVGLLVVGGRRAAPGVALTALPRGGGVGA